MGSSKQVGANEQLLEQGAIHQGLQLLHEKVHSLANKEEPMLVHALQQTCPANAWVS